MQRRDDPDRGGSPVLRALACALPAHYVPQEQILDVLRRAWASRHFNVDRIEQLHRAVQVSGRHLALPLEEYLPLVTFGQRNDAWIRAALDLSEQAARGALDRAGLSPRDVDHVFFVTVTGLATPSIDARLANRLGLRADVKRTPIFGLGCVGGAAGTARAADYLRGARGHAAMLIAAEICSLTLQREDLSIQNIIASGLFGDGAACAVLEGADRGAGGGPRVAASRSVFYPDTERMMGWDVVDSGFQVVLSAQVPELVRERVRGDVDHFLRDHGLSRADIRYWAAHTGGPKVLKALEEALELPPDALARSWASLRDAGNMSSASVLFVLGAILDAREARPGDRGLMLAMGPGFCAELVLLQW